MGSAPKVSPRDRVKVTCECGHKVVNHDPDCFFCACASFTEWTETMYRDYDWKGQKADVRSTASGPVRRLSK